MLESNNACLPCTPFLFYSTKRSELYFIDMEPVEINPENANGDKKNAQLLLRAQ